MLSRIILFSFGLALCGSGCFRQDAHISKPPKLIPTKTDITSTLITEPIPTPPNPAEELNAAILKFRDQKSFRAKLHIQNAKTSFSGTIEFVKPSRMHALIQTSDNQSLDIIITGPNVYTRVNETTWKNISTTPEAMKFSDMLYSFTNGKMSVSQFGIQKNTPVEKTHDAIKNCDLYTAKLARTDTNTQTTQTCIANDIITYVHIEAKDTGVTDIEYYDQNALFLIERPI